MRCINRAFRPGFVLGVFLGIVVSAASSTSHASKMMNPLLGRTHLLASPFTLPAGRVVYGTELHFGVTDFWQIGTNIYRDAFRFYNASTKLSMIDRPSTAAALTLGFETYNYRDIDSSNPDLRITSYLPGAVFAFEILRPLALIVGGQYNYTEGDIQNEDIVTSGYIRGSTVEADIAFAYNMAFSGDSDTTTSDADARKPAPGKKSASKIQTPGSQAMAVRRHVGNTIVPGVSYDATYKLWGFGISHHWPGFQLGVHYYPGATKYPVIPVIVGGGSFDF